MRICSQNGMVDVPYEQVVLEICDQNNKQEYVIYAYTNNPRPYFIATYSTKEKAIKAMEMVREAYMGLPVVFQNANIDDSVLESFKNHNVVLLKSYNEPQSKVEYVNSGIFQFPKDDEIEV